MKRIIFIFTFLFSNAMSNDIRLAPLPMSDAIKTTKAFLPFTDYVRKIMHRNVRMVHFTNYDNILKSLKENKLDLAYLGPLPYASLSLEDSSFVPIIGFNEEDGSQGYHCVVVSSELDFIDFKNLKNKKIALTQPLSTCGYFMTSQLLKELSPTPLSKMKYKYIKKHTKVAESVLRGKFLLGGMKDSIAKNYENLALRVLKSSKILPGFVLVANTNTLTQEDIKKLQTQLLKTPKSEYKNWGQKISFGMFKAKHSDYKQIIEELKTIKIPQKGNF